MLSTTHSKVLVLTPEEWERWKKFPSPGMGQLIADANFVIVGSTVEKFRPMNRNIEKQLDIINGKVSIPKNEKDVTDAWRESYDKASKA